MRKYNKSFKAFIGLLALVNCTAISSAYADEAKDGSITKTESTTEAKAESVSTGASNLATTNTTSSKATTPKETTSVNQATSSKIDSKAYVLRISGIALPLKSATMGGVNLLGGPILSLTLPVNISGYVKPGLNNLELEYISDPKSDFTIVIERRTPGPKTEELAKITVPANDSKGVLAKKTLSFNIAKGEETKTITELTEADKKAILSQFETYYNTLKEHKSEKLRQLYKPCLETERKLVPETTKFFEKVVNREAQKVRNPNIELPAIDKEGLAFKIEGDKVRLYRENNKALLLSNEIEVPPSSVMFEVQPAVPAKTETKTKSVKSKTKEVSKKSDKKAVLDKEHVTQVVAEETTDSGSKISAPNEKEMQVISGVHGVDGTAAETKPAPATPKSLIKENLVRFNLYFMKDESGEGEGGWTLAIPPNV